MIRSVPTLALLFALASTARAQDVDRASPSAALADLHAEASATGFADVDGLRALPWFEDVIRDALRDRGVGFAGIQRVLLMLSHTHSAHASLVRGSGDAAIFATAVLHGDYPRNEVATAVQGVMPGILANLWYATTLDGHRAWDMGVVVLVELNPHDYLLARRIHGTLPMPGATPSEDLRRLVEAGMALGSTAPTTRLAYGVLDGADSALPGQAPPTDLEHIFHGPANALASFGTENGLFVVNWDVTLHHTSDAERWETYYRDLFDGLAVRLHVESSSVTSTITRTDKRLVARIAVDRAAADAFVAEFIGRALPSALSSGTPGGGAASR